ncbi:hypothetical protein [Sphingomonas sp.]|uniref:hypothetical protein n=1 Tax=Sphingomonas sp. TaxID=28214 RepID=UPI0025ECAE82|nr:hypothetical protein [Sphingomonas sp.]
MTAFDPKADRYKRVAETPLMRNTQRMQTLIRRLGISLLASGIAFVAAYQLIFHILWLEALHDASGDGQSGMGAYFGAAYWALVIGVMTFVLIFWRSRTWW